MVVTDTSETKGWSRECVLAFSFIWEVRANKRYYWYWVSEIVVLLLDIGIGHCPILVEKDIFSFGD